MGVMGKGIILLVVLALVGCGINKTQIKGPNGEIYDKYELEEHE